MKGPHSTDTKRRISESLKKYSATTVGKKHIKKMCRKAATSNRNSLSAFNSNITKTDGCWLWNGSLTSNGYGNFRMNKVQGAHRIAWTIANRKNIPKGMVVRHTCHNKRCCNPKHLTIGTSTDNSMDMVKAGRQAKGTSNGRSKLTEADVIAIRKLLSSGVSQTRIAKLFGVSQNAISHINTGKNWSYLQ